MTRVGGNDRISDFNRSEGDRIDLRQTGITGSPTLTAGTFDPRYQCLYPRDRRP